MRIVAVIPARMGSERLPGKVLAPVHGKPLLGHLLGRLECCSELHDVIVATSISRDDDAVESYCNRIGVRVFRGSEEDVQGRLLNALQKSTADVAVLAYGDGPVIDYRIVSQTVGFFLNNSKYDFVSNDLNTTWPPGMEVEVFGVAVLADAESRCEDIKIREHGTLYIRQHPELYRLHNLAAPKELARPDLSFEVDVAEDLRVIAAISDYFDGQVDVSLAELIAFMDERPELYTDTRKVERRWKKYRDM
jgi:spore coat polysaccharide biosynthesis protein SpsF